MLNAVLHNWVICRVYCSQTIKLTVRSIVLKQLNLSCFGEASFEISKRLFRYYRTEMQRAVLPPLPPRSGTTATQPTVKQQRSACDSCLFTSSERHIQVTAGGEDVSDVSRCVIKKNLLSLALFTIRSA